MSPLFNFHKTPKQIYTEEELEQLSQNDDYRRGKLMRDVLMYIACGLCILLAVALVCEYIFDLNFRIFVLGQVKNSFTGIVFFILAMLGIKYSDNKNSN